MPLPINPSSEWPPRPHRKVHTQISDWNGWYAQTDTASKSGGPPPVSERLRGWITGAHATADRDKQVRLPAAADIAQTSADLLFGEPVGWALAESMTDPTQARFDELTGLTGLHNRLLEAAEIAAAHGGVYLRPVWDTTVAGHPLLTVQSPTHAIPEWQFGILRAVTFWEEIHRTTGAVWRHLERHEPGVILHGLYVGTATHLGKATALDSMPQTKGLDDRLVLDGVLTGRLLPVYIPNMLPNRTLPASPSGRADFAGSEDLLRSLR